MKRTKGDMKFIFEEKTSVEQVGDGLTLTNGFSIEDWHAQD